MSVQLHDPILRYDYDALRRIRAHEGGRSGLEKSLSIRKALASDTSAPNWLRDYAGETVEIMRDDLYGDRTRGERRPCADKSCTGYRHTNAPSIYCADHERDPA